MSDTEKTFEEVQAGQKTAMEELYKKTDENLAALRGDDYTPTEEEQKSDEYHSTPDELRDKSTSEKPEEEQEESTSEQSKKTEQTDETDKSSKTEQTDDTSDSKADEHAITHAENRAALHSGLSQEDVDALVDASPEIAKKSCAKFLESQNNLSKKFSEAGKTLVTQKEEPAVPITPTPTPQPKSIDFTALEKEYENDPIVGVLKQVVEQSQAQAAEITTLREISPRADAMVDKAQVAQDAAVSQQIDTFFERPDVAAYKDAYGTVDKGSKDWDALTQGQIKKRYEVAEQANLIMLGAEKQGVEMPLDEAFERAHFLVTKDVQEQAIRKTIKAKAVKRGKSLTLAPTDSVKVPDTGKKTMTKTYANAEVLLAKLRKGR